MGTSTAVIELAPRKKITPPTPIKIPNVQYRNKLLDGLKYLAAISIVLHHVAASGKTGLGFFLTSAPLWGLFFFFIVAGYLHGPIGDRGWDWTKKRFVRLGLPYLFWSVVYIAYQYLLLGDAATFPKALNLIFFGGAHGLLWALPMLFYCALFVEVFVKNKTARRLLIVLGIAATAGIYYYVPLGQVYASPLQHFILGPRWLFVYLLGMEIRSMKKINLPSWMLFLTAPILILSAGILGFLTRTAWTSPLVIIPATALWILAALNLLIIAKDNKSYAGIEKLWWGKDYLLGVYLSHVIWLGIFISLVPQNIISGNLWILSGWLFCIVGATLTTIVLKSFKFTARFVN